MKLLVLSLLFAVVLSNNIVDRVKEATTECGGENGGPNDLGTLVKQADADKTKLGKISLCANKKLGILNDNGDVAEEAFKTFANIISNNEDEKKKIYDDCGKPEGDTPEIKAFNFLKCVESKKH